MGSTNVTFLNYSFEVSNRSNISDKTLQITFLLSENYLQYLMLLKWFELEDYTKYDQDNSDTVLLELGNTTERVDKSDYYKYQYESGQNPYYTAQGPMLNSYLYLMDNFMKRKVTFQFEGCWLKNITHVELDYSKTDNTEMSVTFTLSFYKYNIFNNSDDIKKFFSDNKSY